MVLRSERNFFVEDANRIINNILIIDKTYLIGLYLNDNLNLSYWHHTKNSILETHYWELVRSNLGTEVFVNLA